MKNIYRLVFVLFTCIIAMSGCQEKYEEEFKELQLDYTSMNIKYEGGKYTFMVYYSGDWTIGLDEDVDWVTFDRTSGNGVTMINVEFNENDALKRSVNMVISGGGESQVIPVTQASPISTIVLEFMNKETIELANCAGQVVAKLRSNLPPSFIEALVPETEAKWIDGCEVRNGAGTSEYIYDVAFNVPANESGSERSAKISLQFSDSDEKVYKAEVTVLQSNQPGELVMRGNAMYGAAGRECFEEVRGGLLNFADFADKIKCSVSGDDFLQNVKVDGGLLCFTMPENTTPVSRQAEITLVYGDNLATATMKVVQREAGVKNIYSISTLDDLRAWNKATWSAGDLVVLEADINCSGFDASTEWEAKHFSGKFEGNGHTIDDFVIEKAGATAFFQRVIDSGKVSDLTFGPGCSFTAKAAEASLNKNTYAASLAAFVGGTASFTNVVNKGSVKVSSDATGGTGANFIGGICGFFNSKGTMEGCRNHGAVVNEAVVSGWTCLGGVVGCISVSGANTVMSGNINTADVKNTVDLTYSLAIGGVAGRVNLNASMSMNACENSGNLINTKNAGGVYMAGLLSYVDDTKKKLSVKFEDCKASGNIRNECVTNKSKTALGGFAGFCYSNEITGCRSEVKILNSFGEGTNIYVGGFVGQIEGADPISTRIDDCSADVEVSSKVTAYSGIMIGRLTYTPTATKTVSVTNIKVSGKYGDTVLTGANYKSYCYGSAGGNNNYKPLDGVTFN